jgi:hypothetical protein
MPKFARSDEPKVNKCQIIKGASNNYQFVTPAPYQVRGKLRRESSFLIIWFPAFAGMTFLGVALNFEILNFDIHLASGFWNLEFEIQKE